LHVEGKVCWGREEIWATAKDRGPTAKPAFGCSELIRYLELAFGTG
jgi:hypothetical protein